MLESKQGLWNFSSKIMIKGSLVSLSEANGWWQTCYFPSMHRAAGIKYIKYYVRPIWMQSSHQSGERGNKDWTADRYLVHTRYLKSPLIKNNLMNRNGDVVGIGIQLGKNCTGSVFPGSLHQSHSLIRCGAACHTATKRKWLYRLFTIDDHNPVIGRMPKTVFDACCLLRGDSWSLAPTSWHISNGKVIPIGTFQIHGPIILLVHSTSTVTANRTWWPGGQTDMDSLTDTRKL